MRQRLAVENARDSIPGGNQHALMLELFSTIDDAASRIGMAVDDVAMPVVKAINDLEARLEAIEDQLTRIASAVKEMGPI